MIQDKMQWYWINKNSLLLTFLVFFVVQFCTFFPSLWAMDTRPPTYVYNMTILFYLPLLILTVTQFAIVYPERCKFLDHFDLNNKKLVIVFCILFILLGNNGRAIYDIIWEAPYYNAQLNERYKKMAKSVGQDLVVEELLYKPKSIFYSDIGNDPQSDRNKRYAQYFHLRSITTESSNVNRN
jgi:hypothetical protein